MVTVVLATVGVSAVATPLAVSEVTSLVNLVPTSVNIVVETPVLGSGLLSEVSVVATVACLGTSKLVDNTVAPPAVVATFVPSTFVITPMEVSAVVNFVFANDVL